MGPEMAAVVVPLAGMTMIVTIVLGIPLVRAYTKRVESRGAAPAIPGDVTARLERIEHAIDAMAVEVERIAEGQRFTTKLLSERASERDALPHPTTGGRT
ncbi:MAG TPA: hypothetical protein VHM30_06790 [Gemmatimonadaceae bacterium]|nr:hypothetical protein [Gemmatimonadaceae bacterium]